MTKNNNLSTRTSNTRLRRKKIIPGWVIAVIVLSVVGTGLYLVYYSFASSTSDTRIGDGDGGSYSTLYCKRNNGSPTGWICFRRPGSGLVAKQVVTARDNGCLIGLKYRFAGAFKGPWGCVYNESI